MKLIRYFFEYILIIIFFGLSKLLGYKNASEFGYFFGKKFGPLFRSKKIIENNLIIFNNSLTPEKITHWKYGDIYRGQISILVTKKILYLNFEQ